MKIKAEYVLKEFEGKFVVFPVGEEAIRFKGIINLNATGAFIWQTLQKEMNLEDLIITLMNEYHISYELAKKDCLAFVDILNKHKLLG